MGKCDMIAYLGQVGAQLKYMQEVRMEDHQLLEEAQIMFEDCIWEVGKCRVSLFSAASYFADWVCYSILLIISVVWGASAVPHKTEFSIVDISIMYSYIPENETYAPVWYLLTMIIVMPLVIFALFDLWYLMKSKKNMKIVLWDFHMAILGSYGSCAAQLLLVVIIKNIAGVARPDFLSRCKPDYRDLDLNLENPLNAIYTDLICQEPSVLLINEGYRSFPSGHSSTVFSSQTFLGLYMIGKLRIIGNSYFSWKLVFAILYPLTVALKISFSRISDNRHKSLDVLIGDFIGFLFGISFYFLYFSNPFTESLSAAYPPRKIQILENAGTCIRLKVSHYKFNPLSTQSEHKLYTESIDEPTFNVFQNKNSQRDSYTMPLRLKIKNNDTIMRPSSSHLRHHFDG